MLAVYSLHITGYTKHIHMSNRVVNVLSIVCWLVWSSKSNNTHHVRRFYRCDLCMNVYRISLGGADMSKNRDAEWYLLAVVCLAYIVNTQGQ